MSRFDFAMTMFYFPVKKALKIDPLQTAAGQFAVALPQLVTQDLTQERIILVVKNEYLILL